MDQLVYSYLYSTVTARRPLSGQVTDSWVQLNLLLRKKRRGNGIISLLQVIHHGYLQPMPTFF